MPTRRRAPRSPSRPLVRLRLAGARGFWTRDVTCPPETLEPLAAQWMYIMRNRHRWMADEGLRHEVEGRAKEAMNYFRQDRSIGALRRWLS